jgi:hypothetical protein
VCPRLAGPSASLYLGERADIVRVSSVWFSCANPNNRQEQALEGRCRGEQKGCVQTSAVRSQTDSLVPSGPTQALYAAPSNHVINNNTWLGQSRCLIGDVYYGAVSFTQPMDAQTSLSDAAGSGSGLGRGAGEPLPTVMSKKSKKSVSRQACRGELAAEGSSAFGDRFQAGTLGRIEELLRGRAEDVHEDERMPHADPALRDLDLDGRMPYLLITVAAQGYVRISDTRSRCKLMPQCSASGGTVVMAREELDNRNELVWPFLLSSGWCGSERTGFFRTQESMLVSDALALSAGSDFFVSNSGSGTSTQVCRKASSKASTR